MRPDPRKFLAAAALILLAASSCRVGPTNANLQDLAADLPVADRQSRWEVVQFGTPSAEMYQERGFFRAVPAEAVLADRYAWARSYLWARREAHIVFKWPEVVARTAILDMAPYPGLRGQTVDVLLNGESLGVLELPERRRLRLALPAAKQKAGENKLKLVFGQVAPPGGPLGRRLSAAVYALTIGAAGDAALDDLASPGAPPPFSLGPEGLPLGLTQVGPSSLIYAMRLPGDAELHFTPSLHPGARAAGASVRLAVTLEDRPGGEREIWSQTLAASAPTGSTVKLPLSAPPGASVRLGLHVSGVKGDRFAWGAWGFPAIFVPRALAPSPQAADLAADRRADGLRRSVAKASVLFILLDAAAAGHFGCYGYARTTTPEIDRIASEGVVFDRAYTPAVFTLAAMGSVWTSLYPDVHHYGVPYDAPLPKGPLTLAELLGAQGVHTAGWVANGMAGPAFGLDRGFAEFHEIFREHGYNADAFARVLPEWFRQHADRRFFAYAHVREPHFPYTPPPPFDTRFGPAGPLPASAGGDQGWLNRVNSRRVTLTPQEADHLVRLYDGNLAFADQQVGALRRSLEALGLWDRTVVVVAADHGEQLLEHGFVGHNQQLYDESARVPLIVRFPKGAGPAGARVGALVDLMDVAPTVADVFGVLGKGGSDRAFGGRSLLPVLFGAPGKDAIFTRNAAGQRPSYALRDGRFAFLRNARYGDEELYDVTQDPRERQQLVDKDPLAASYYRQRLSLWLLGLGRDEGEEGGVKAQLTPEQRENLKALGYVE